jgi:hypothetical protein
MESLTDIANRHNCDKGTQAFEKHGYTEVYQYYIRRDVKRVLLEIGVWKGDSMKMWKEYNPELIVHGIDIAPLCTDCENVHVGNQSDGIFLLGVLRKIIQPIHYIIDDGSHRHEDIVSSFMHLYPNLVDEGHYFIEDLHAPQAQRDLTIEKVQAFAGKQGELVCDGKLFIIRK